MSSYPFPNAKLTWMGCLLGLALLAEVTGCGRRSEDSALDSDANGFVCLDCQAKFYTDREVFANHCPACDKTRVEMVLGFVCPVDGVVTYAPRGKGAAVCAQCGKTVSNVAIPTKLELVGWGAEYKTGAEVGVP